MKIRKAAQAGTQLPTIAPALYLAVVAVLVVGALAVIVATKGRLGFAAEEAGA